MGNPYYPTPVPIFLSVVLHKDIRQGPFVEVTEGDTQWPRGKMFPNGSLIYTAGAVFRVFAMIRSKFNNWSAWPDAYPEGSLAFRPSSRANTASAPLLTPPTRQSCPH